MSNHERSGVRDLTISAWHRIRLGEDCKAFDLDLVGMCPDFDCAANLYVIEAAKDSERDKPTTWTCATANRLNVPGILVRYTVHVQWPPEVAATKTSEERVANIRTLTATRVHPEPKTLIGGEVGLRNYLTAVRAGHSQLCHFTAHQEANR